MSKATELRALKFGRSIDTPVNFRRRTGDSESGGNMLDLYAQAESVEDVIFGREEELSKQRFLKGFRFYLRKVFTDQEREFLKRFMSGKENPREIGRAMGVNWFDYMQGVQGKAFENIKPLLRLSKLSGWSGAAEFIAIVLQRLSMLENGAELSEILPQNKKIVLRRASEKVYREAHREEIAARNKAYREANPEKLREYKKAYLEAHREKIHAKEKAYREAHREEIAARNKAYREANRGKRKVYCEAHREEFLAYQRVYQKAHREKLREYQKAYREAHREKLREYQKAYREAHREEAAAYRKAYREKKKAQGAKNE